MQSCGCATTATPSTLTSARFSSQVSTHPAEPQGTTHAHTHTHTHTHTSTHNAVHRMRRSVSFFSPNAEGPRQKGESRLCLCLTPSFSITHHPSPSLSAALSAIALLNAHVHCCRRRRCVSSRVHQGERTCGCGQSTKRGRLLCVPPLVLHIRSC